jgi:hypothetical protein
VLHERIRADDRGIGDVVRELVQNGRELVRCELALARLQVTTRLKALSPALGALAGATLLALAGVVVLVQGGAAVLALWLPAWAALLPAGALAIAVAAGIAGLAVKAIGRGAETLASAPSEADRAIGALQDNIVG